MPPILVAFFVLIGLGGLGALSDSTAPIWGKKDRNAHSGGKLPPPSFFSTLSVPPRSVATRLPNGREACKAYVHAVTPGIVTRVQIDGIEQNIDVGWSVLAEAGPAQRRKVTVRYLDPVGGAELACHTLQYICEPAMGWDGRLQATVAHGEPCAAEVEYNYRKNLHGAPKLVVHAPRQIANLRFINTASGGFMVGSAPITAEIVGELDEDWYCPGVRWIFPLEPGLATPDGQKSEVESDCDPWRPEFNSTAERRWTRHVTLPEGEWKIRVELFHGDHVFASQSVVIQIGSQEDPFARSR